MAPSLKAYRRQKRKFLFTPGKSGGFFKVPIVTERPKFFKGKEGGFRMFMQKGKFVTVFKKGKQGGIVKKLVTVRTAKKKMRLF